MKRSPFSSAARSGFALISTLAILVIVTILVVAYASTMRSERAASQNFSERERAQAIAQGMLNRILADHAAPILKDGKALKSYADPEYYDEKTKLPKANSPYNADPPAAGIFSLQPQPEISAENNTLARISKSSTGQGEAAYTPADWAYMRQKVPSGDQEEAEKIKAFYPQDKTGTPVAPQWVDYYEPLSNASDQHSDVPSGQVAFVIWDESGKVDLNMAGRDPNVNGMAPHDLRLENLSTSPSDLLAYLNGPSDSEADKTKPRQRSNFSLRTITGAGGNNNDTGNDRWFFTDEELLTKKLLDPKTAALQVTTVSRDFDVRPEWDGDRTGTKAQKFLRSYINNPELFALFNTDSDVVSARLIARCVNANGTPVGQDALDLVANEMTSKVGGLAENWNQVLHLLATLRISLPPYQPTSLTSPETSPLSMSDWYDEDIFGILLNILQATSPASDQNLIAYDRTGVNLHRPFGDPNCRVGIRIGPYITEIAVKIRKTAATTLEATEYMEIWNPYAFPLLKPDGQTPISYTYGEWTGSEWPSNSSGNAAIYGMKNPLSWSTPGGNPSNITGPGPGKFTVVKLPPRLINLAPGNAEGDRYATDKGFLLRVRTFLQNYDYFREHKAGNTSVEDESTSYAISSGPLYTSTEASKMFAWFPKPKVDALIVGDPSSAAWYSFQIDDPRMGGATRSAPNYKPEPPATPVQPAGFGYSWVAYVDTHSLFDEPRYHDELEMKGTLIKFKSVYGDGYNENFGKNWPSGEPFSLDRALATFSLPGRPYANVGEMGSVFAQRPWRTLSYGLTTVPTDPALRALAQSKSAQNYPSTLLDYLTTIGNTTSSRGLNFKTEGGAPLDSKQGGNPEGSNATKRQQDLTWLFDKVDKNKLTASSNIRPIRGRINLNAASTDTLTRLLSAPYRLVPSLGLLQEFAPSKSAGHGWVKANGDLVETSVQKGDAATLGYDYQVTIAKADAELIAAAITERDSKKGIRPLRSLADLGKLDLNSKAGPTFQQLRSRYPDSVMDAIFGRLAQFGTVRQQYYTVDMIAQTLNANAEKRRKSNPNAPRVVTSEIRLLARVYFDTFSRKAYIESIEYR